MDSVENRQLLQTVEKPLLIWYESVKRDLPWRKDPDAYHVWVSEIMLQQTRVEAVKEYYQRFIKELPDIATLAHAREDELLKLWEGLGYYNRVRNMQKAALIVLEQYHGQLPPDHKALSGLPGIGSYTAGAIASIAYQIPVPAVDGNVLRVLMRILENGSDILKQSVKKQVEQLLTQVMPKERPGIYNQALMELGALVCVPNGAPKCLDCPIRELCRAQIHGTAGYLPVKRVKKARRIEQKTVFVILDGENAVVRKREQEGLLAGLYELPNTEGRLTETEAWQWVREEGFCPLEIEALPEAKHVFSHVEWHMMAYMVKVRTAHREKEKTDSQKGCFLTIEKEKIREEIPIPSAFAYYQKYLYQSQDHRLSRWLALPL